jgi:hypothetical protein
MGCSRVAAGVHGLQMWRVAINRPMLNKSGKGYSLKNTNIPKAFFTPHHIGRCCTNAIPGHCCVVGHSCINVIHGCCCFSGYSCTNMSPNLCYATMSSNNDLRSIFLCDPRSHCCATMCSNNGSCLVSRPCLYDSD